jgi:crotonobetainyl-CoA:carnitine CoA-transferase CaiB-like acyl-CoA transferase
MTDTPPTTPPDRPPRALEGLRVIDLSRVVAGPLCTQTLADHGADVIKVESPGGDETRHLGPPFTAIGSAAYFGNLNRGKRALALDLTRPDAREVLLRLLEGADILVENLLPGTMERWGLGFEHDLLPRFPGLIYCSISGFGRDGPLGGLPGYDAVLQAMCGLMSINGDPAGGPTRVGVPIVDLVTGHMAVSGVLMAVLARNRTGRGQRVEATLFDSALSILVPQAVNWMHSGRPPGLLGSAHPSIAAYDRYRCADGEIFLGVVNDGQFRRFCEHVGLNHLLTDPRFSNNAQRMQHRPALRDTIENTLSARTRYPLCDELMAAGVPIGPVNSIPEAFALEHTRHRKMAVTGEGDYQSTGIPLKLSDTPGSPGKAPPAFAADTDAILAEHGYDETARAKLRASGAVLERLPR